MNKKEHMIADLDSSIDHMCDELTKAKQNLKKLKKYYHDDPDMNEERLFLLIGEIVLLSRSINYIKQSPDIFQTDQDVIAKMQYGDDATE